MSANHDQQRQPYLLPETPEASPWKIIRAFPLMDKLRAVKAMIHTTRNPEYTNGIFQILDLFIKHEKRLGGGISELLEKVANDPAIRDSLAEKYLPEPPVVEELARLPEGTLGKAFATHMQTNNLDVNFYPEVEVTSDFRWLEMRGRQTHDIFHVVTGFSTSVPDELGLMAFILGQFESPLAGGIIGGGLVHASLFCPWEINKMMEAVTRGYLMGRHAKLIIGYRFEENWEKPIEEIRSDLDIQVAC